MLLTSSQPTIILEPGYYETETVVTSNISPVVDAEFEYEHHVHAQNDGESTSIINKLSSSNSIEAKPEYLSSPSGCYTQKKEINTSHASYEIAHYADSEELEGQKRTCPICGRTVTGWKWRKSDGNWDSAIRCNGGGVEYRYYPDCGYDNGEVTDIKIHFEKE